MTFEEFVGDRLDALLRYATALCCDPYLAQDVVQEVLLRAQVRWGRIGGVAQPQAYVKKMVTNEYLSWRRRRASRDVAMSMAALEQVGAMTDPMSPLGNGYDQDRRADQRRLGQAGHPRP
ncbi:sigma factor [Actinocrispum sp. NPDC049592]|uniref:RNA polymerase sigma factor n=1 Tax=Actinocrispum sp. NPDC049592 TaxID=3154835 RepID=UPI00341F412D